MNFRLFFTLIGLGLGCILSGCVKNISTSNDHELVRKKHSLLAEGYSEAYSNAYIEGCKLGRSAPGAQYTGSVLDAEAWQSGYDACREQFLEDLQRKNYKIDGNDQTANNSGFNERQQKIWEQLRK